MGAVRLTHLLHLAQDGAHFLLHRRDHGPVLDPERLPPMDGSPGPPGGRSGRRRLQKFTMR